MVKAVHMPKRANAPAFGLSAIPRGSARRLLRVPIAAIGAVILLVPSAAAPKQEADAVSRGWPGPASIADSVGVHVEPWHTPLSELQRIRRAGVTTVRWGISWEATEKTRNHYDWREADHFARMLDQVGLRSVVVMGLANPLYGDPRIAGSPPVSATAIRAFAAFAGEAADRYKASPITWELWNEPDLKRFWPPAPDPDAYGRLAGAACRSIKSRAPHAMVIGPASAGMPDPTKGVSVQWMTALQRSGAWTCFDGISAHFYNLSFAHPRPTPAEVAPHAAAASRWIEQLNAGRRRRPLLCTEWGYPTHGPLQTADGGNAVKMSLINLVSGVPLTIVYQWRDHGRNLKDPEDNFGLLDYGGDDKGGAGQLARYLSVAGRAQVVGRLNIGRSDDYLISLRYPDGKRALIAWTETETGGPARLLVDGAYRQTLSSTPAWISLPAQYRAINIAYGIPR
jgi:hypothetical protein